MKYCLSLLACLLCYTLTAQYQDTIKHTVYFEIDQDSLTLQERTRLDDFVQENKDKGSFYRLIGHTDNTGNEQYNLELSERRATTVHTYLHERYYPKNTSGLHADPYIIYSTFEGEKQPVQSNNTAAQRAKNRRVDVYLLDNGILEPTQPITAEDFIQNNPTIEEQPIINTIGINTPEELAPPLTINGVQFYCNDRSALLGGAGGGPRVVLTGEQAYDANLTTYTNEGVPLVSEGMVSVAPCAAGESTALTDTITVRVPINSNSTEIPNLYDIDAQGNWVLREGEGPEVVEENGQRFYSTTISNCGWINFDIPKDSGQVKIKPVGNLLVRKIHLVENYPNYNYDLQYNLQSREATVMPEAIRVDSRAYVYCTIRAKNKIKTYKLPLTYLNGTRKVKTYPTINKKRVSWWRSIFRKTEPLEYVCYKLHARDLKEFKPIKEVNKANG